MADLEFRKKEVRERTFAKNIEYLERMAYGFNMPIWLFVSENDQYSETKTQKFIADVLGDHAEDEYLKAYMYIAIRVLTTEYASYTVEDDYAFGPTAATICWPGEARKMKLYQLKEYIRDNNPNGYIAGQIYGALKDNPNHAYALFLQAAGFSYDEEEEKAEGERFDAYYEDHPEERKNLEEEYSEEELDQVTQEFEEEESHHDRLQEFKDQNKKIRETFPEKEKYIECVDTYCRCILKFGDKKEYARGDEGTIFASQLKKYMLATPYTIFSDRSTVVRVNSLLIHARALAGADTDE